MSWTEEDYAAHMARLKQPAEPKPTPKPKRNKYGVSPKEERTVDGRIFASKAEAKAYQDLLLMKQAGQIAEIELQPAFAFPMGFEYRADFRVWRPNGRSYVIDVKGVETPVFKLKRKCLEYFYPDVRLEIW